MPWRSACRSPAPLSGRGPHDALGAAVESPGDSCGVMDGIAPQDLVLFSAATFAASLIAGLAGFAFGLVAAAIWLHVLTPLQTTTLIVAFGLVVQASRSGGSGGACGWIACGRSLPAVRSVSRSAPNYCAGPTAAHPRRRRRAADPLQPLQLVSPEACRAYGRGPRCGWWRRVSRRRARRDDGLGRHSPHRLVQPA